MKKHKFHWIDGLVLAVVVLLIAGTCLKFLVLDTTSVKKETVDFSYQIRIANLRQYTVEALQVGDTLYDNEGKGQVGVIEEIAVEDAVSSVSYPDGTFTQVPVEGRFDVTLTLRAQGVPEDGTYKVGTYTIKVNQENLYFTKYSIWNGSVVGITGAES